MTDNHSMLGPGLCNPSTQALLAVALLVVLPIVMLGHPGFYGDDLNLRGALDQHGLVGAMRHWIDHYGVGYRPGMAISFGLYDLIGDLPGIFYFINTAAFLALAATIYGVVARLTGDRMLAVFAGAFVALFPLSSTAYLQLSSICMFLAILVVVPLSGRLLASSDRYGTWPRACGIGVLWVVALLIYEQPIALYAFFAIALIAALRVGASGHSRPAVFRLGVAVTVGTALFLAGYLMNSGNPKIVSLKTISDQNTVAATTLLAGDGAASSPATTTQFATREPAKQNTAPSGQRSRAALLVTFFGRNTIYALESMAAAPWVLGAFVTILVLTAAAILRMQVVTVARRVSLGYIVFGSLWTFLSVLPFFLYGRFTAPPYVFVLPSIGLGVASYGVYWAMLPSSHGVRYGPMVLKALTVGMIALFALQQYGYFFGLRDELQYSRSLAARLQPYKRDLLDGTVLRLNGLPVKSNAHIFWIEKAVGYRAFFTAMGDEFAGIEMRWREAGSLEISIPKRLPARPQAIPVNY